MNISKYYWDLNNKALKETKKILKDPLHSLFLLRLVTLLSRCDKPKELFSIIPKKKFIETWPKARSYWIKLNRQSDLRDWWQTIYEELLEKYQQKQKKVRGKSAALFQKIGQTIKIKRIEKGLTQKQLAFMTGMKQPDISAIEEGKKNITLFTLLRLCKILGIKTIEMDSMRQEKRIA